MTQSIERGSTWLGSGFRGPLGMVFGAVLLFSGIAPALAEAESASLVLANATLIDGTGAGPRPGVTLVVEDGKIAGIHEGDAPDPPAGARVVDLSGRFVLPGLIDAHVHLSANPEAQAALEELLHAGVTTVRDMGGDARTLAVLARDAGLGAITAPDIHYSAVFYGSPFLQDPRSRFSARGVEPGQAPWSRVVTGDSDLRQLVAEARGTGATGIKVYSAVAPELLARIVKESHGQGLKVWSHATIFPSKPSDAVVAGVDVLSHSGALYPEARPDVPASFTEAITKWMPEQDFAAVDPAAEPFPDLYASMRDKGTMLEPTLSKGRHQRATEGGPKQAEHLARAAQRIDLAARWQWACDATRAAHEAGVTIVAGTDSNGGTHMVDEMETLVECGLSPLAAIQAATLNGARAIGIEATHGSVEVGKVADLAILAGDPAGEIAHVRNVVGTVKAGRVYGLDGAGE